MVEIVRAISILGFLLSVKVWEVMQVQGFIVSVGFANIIAVTNLFGRIINVLFDIILIRAFGFASVFWATLIVHSLNIMLVSAFYFKKLKDNK